jgi:heptosyltransferase II
LNHYLPNCYEKGIKVKLWNRFEQFFKHRMLRFLEFALGKPEMSLDEFDPSEVKRILIVRQHDQLGDFLISTPALRAIRAQFPNAFVAIVARKYTSQLVENHRHLDKVITFYESGRDWNLKYAVSFWQDIRQKYDLAIVLNTVSHSLTSDLIARFSKAKYILGPEHILYKGTSRNFFYNLPAPWRDEIVSQSERNVDIVRAIGCDTLDYSQEITITDNEKEIARKKLLSFGWDGESEFVAFHPGAGKIPNRWAVKKFAHVASQIHRDFGYKIYLTWGPNEADLGNAFLEINDIDIISGVEANIKIFAAILSHAKLLVCNDTGVMHVGAAVGTPIVSVFGPTDPVQWKPVGEKFIAVRTKDHKCASVKEEQVYDAICSLLK